MTEKPKKKPIRWSAQIERKARLLFAFGHSGADVSRILVCDRATLTKYLGNLDEIPPLSVAEMDCLMDAYDHERNLFEVLMATSGTAEQSRLRASLRARTGGSKPNDPPPATLTDRIRKMSDDELSTDLERLVGCPVQIQQRSEPDPETG